MKGLDASWALPGSLGGVAHPFALLWKYRRLLAQTVSVDIKVRFVGSLLGLSWVVLYPLILLAAYAFVYIFVFRIRVEGIASIDYVLFLMSGLIPFLGFSEALQASITSITGNASLLRNSLFPIEMIPVKVILAGQVKQVVSMLLLLLAAAVAGHWSWATLLVVPFWAAQLCLLLGMGWVLAATNTYIRDIQNVSGLLTLFLMLASPIAYSVDMVPSELQTFVWLNPLTYLIVPWQDVVVRGVLPDVFTITMLCLQSLFVFVGGFWFFARLRNVLVDYV